MRKFFFSTLMVFFVILFSLISNVFASETKDWKCHTNGLKSFYKCTQSDFFYQRIQELINNSKDLSRENKDYLLKDAKERKDTSIFNEGTYGMDSYLLSLSNLLTYSLIDISEQKLSIFNNDIDADYYNNVINPKINNKIQDFLDYIEKSDKSLLEENPFLEEFDSPIPGIKDYINSEYDKKIKSDNEKNPIENTTVEYNNDNIPEANLPNSLKIKLDKYVNSIPENKKVSKLNNTLEKVNSIIIKFEGYKKSKKNTQNLSTLYGMRNYLEETINNIENEGQDIDFESIFK